MNEETMTTETFDDDDWGDIDLSDLTEEEPDASEPEEEGSEEKPAEEPSAEEPAKPAEQKADAPTAAPMPEVFELRHFSGNRTVNRDEVIAYAQKGMDYDNIRAERDTANEKLYWLNELAKSRGTDVDELIDALRATDLVNREKIDMDVAKGRIQNERAARNIEIQKQQLESGKTAETTGKTEAEARRDADIQAFFRAFPEAAKDINSIPQEVWDAVNGGESLVNAYRAYEVKSLKAENQRLKQEAAQKIQQEKNRSRTAGSQASRGAGNTDPFDAAWYDGT